MKISVHTFQAYIKTIFYVYYSAVYKFRFLYRGLTYILRYIKIIIIIVGLINSKLINWEQFDWNYMKICLKNHNDYDFNY